MALTSLQVCMDSSDWLQGTMHDDIMDNSSSSPSAADILTCSRPLIERRLRPPQDTALKCPRAIPPTLNSATTASPSQGTSAKHAKGGTLRNIPVGGGCRKNKKLPNKISSSSDNDNNSNSSSSSNPNHIINNYPGSSSTSHSPTHLQLSFPEVQFSHLNLLGSHGSGLINDPSGNFMDTKYNALFENSRAIDFIESKYHDHDDHLDNSRIISHNFMGNGEHQLGMLSNGFSDHTNFHGINYNGAGFATPPYGMPLDQGNYNSGSFMDPNCHSLMLPDYEEQVGGINHDHEVKPNTKLLALEWQQDQLGCADQIGASGKDVHPFGYGLGTWSGLINSYGSSAVNPLV